MNCKQAREAIHAAMDEPLPLDANAGLESHLGECAACARYRAVFDALKNRLTAAGAASAAAGFSRAQQFAASSVFVAGGENVSRTGGFPLGRRQSLVYATAAGVLVAILVFAAMALFVPSHSIADTTLRQHRLWGSGRLVLDSHARCCRELREWLGREVDHPVAVPEVNRPGLQIEGGKLHRHVAGDAEIVQIACNLEGTPVSLFVCCGPRLAPCAGRRDTAGDRQVAISNGQDYTMVSWRAGEFVYVLIASLETDESKSIVASISD